MSHRSFEYQHYRPRLRVKLSNNFSCINMSFTAYVLCSLRLFKLGIEGQTIMNISRNPHRKATKMYSKFSQIQGQFHLVLNNPARSSTGKVQARAFLNSNLTNSIFNSLLDACMNRPYLNSFAKIATFKA